MPALVDSSPAVPAAETVPIAGDWQFARLVERRGDGYRDLKTFGRRVFAASRYDRESYGDWNVRQPIEPEHLARLRLPPGSTAWRKLTAEEVRRWGLDQVRHGGDFYFLRSK